MLARSLVGLSEAGACRSLVASSTTMLGLVKHATFVERVWFEEAVTGQSRTDTGIAADPEESFGLAESDTIETVLERIQNRDRPLPRRDRWVSGSMQRLGKPTRPTPNAVDPSTRAPRTGPALRARRHQSRTADLYAHIGGRADRSPSTSVDGDQNRTHRRTPPCR